MSRQDYQAIARGIYAYVRAADHVAACCRESVRLAANGIMLNMIEAFEADNPRFDRARFIEACETGQCKGMSK